MFGKKDVYQNQLPDDLKRELAEAKAVKVTPLQVGEKGFDNVIFNGSVKWAVNIKGILKVIPKHHKGIELKHSVLFNGQPVIAAGEADIAGYDGQYMLLEINNDSGHYQPRLSSLKLGIAAFKAAGVVIPENLQ